MGRQFSLVSSQYGAPMGRKSFMPHEPTKVAVFRVRLDRGGYDDGGAYWGTGQPLYCVRGGDVQLFFRANSRNEVLEKFKQPDLRLLTPLRGRSA